ncbi:MAG: DUF3592 domain-containing protein [Gemmataceae bacterium]
MTQTSARPPGCFFAIFLILGLILTVVFGYQMVWLPLRVYLFFVQTECVVLDSRLEEHRDADGLTHRPMFHIEYAAAGQLRRTWTYDASGIFSDGAQGHQAALRQFQKGQRYPCWYDPANPDSAVLTRTVSPWSLMVLIPLLFLVIGVVGLLAPRSPPTRAEAQQAQSLTGAQTGILLRVLGLFFGGFIAAAAVSIALVMTFAGKAPFWMIPVLFFGPFVVYILVLTRFVTPLFNRWKRAMPSPERAAAASLAQPDSTPDQELGRAVVLQETDDWPTIPAGDDLPAGRQLTFQLTSDSHPGCFLVGAFLLACFWNGIVSVFLFQVIAGHQKGRPDWFLTLFLIPFLVVGVVLLGVVLFALYCLLTRLLAGHLRVELASHPLQAGDSCHFLVEQVGLVGLRQVRLVLKCVESAKYTAGTSTSTATKEVFRTEVAGPAPHLAEGLRGTLIVPPGVMHSFQGKHNSITWKLEVNGWVAGLLPHAQEYPVVVRPACGEPHS